ncbi:MAG TPA: DUF1343 domain-containing protein [Bacteroidaceae bacterium]|nr:DUF1343 domain-containing protein [Bacteroidaceae bacterium]
MKIIALVIFTVCSLSGCSQGNRTVITGAEQIDQYLPLIEGLRIAVVANHTSVVKGTHLVDTLAVLGVEPVRIMKVFVPEHGFRGDFDAGVSVGNEKDPVTGIPLVSLYGQHKKPLPEDLEDVDMVIFDIQDVGVRFFTYISTLHYVMESCAENEVPLLVLDRPNPNNGYIDGPVLESSQQSFVGMHRIPVVYGMTIGELALMINGEGWLTGGIKCDLRIVPCENYQRGKHYSLPVNPSPNLPNDHSVKLYPSTCFFEGTVISEGRGTCMPFEVYGHPLLPGEFSFTPVSIPGMSQHPKLKDQLCYGKNLRDFIPESGWNRIFLSWLMEAYHQFPEKDKFFLPYFEKLAGTVNLREQIEAGWDEQAIRESWKPGLDEFKKIRRKYLLYP